MSTFGCPHCGHANDLQAPFCAHCGTNLRNLDTSSLLMSSGDADEDAAPAPRDVTEAAGPPPPLPWEQPWLRPDFDRESADAGPDEPLEVSPEQPWLLPQSEESDVARAPQPSPQRLLTGLQGLLEPIDADTLGTMAGASSPPRPAPALDDERRRVLRQRFAGEAPLAEETGARLRGSGTPENGPGEGLRRRPWLEWLLGLGVLAALLLGDRAPEVGPHLWPGVAQAHELIDALPEQGIVLVDWAYDPATAGEMDLVARPVIEHLLERQARLVVVSQLPTGPATARRLIAAASATVHPALQPRGMGGTFVEGGFLPGGAATLPLLGEAPRLGLPVDPTQTSPRVRSTIAALDATAPLLSLVIAARAEDVQRWLEQVQPLNHAPVIAVTSAAVDPAVRPYWDSGQIAGLVSGYDGGVTYRAQSARPVLPDERERLWRQITGHNWGFGLLLLVIGLGNLALLAERRLS